MSLHPQVSVASSLSISGLPAFDKDPGQAPENQASLRARQMRSEPISGLTFLIVVDRTVWPDHGCIGKGDLGQLFCCAAAPLRRR
jgi:hypothetical protein